MTTELIQTLARRGSPRLADIEGREIPWHDPNASELLLAAIPADHGLASARPYRPERATVESRATALVHWLGLKPGDQMLNVTCGIGMLVTALGFRGVLVTGTDPSPTAIRTARRLCAGVPTTLQSADVRTLDFAADSFDAVLYLDGQAALRTPDELRQVLQRLRRVLRPGAPLALEVADPQRAADASSAWGVAVDPGAAQERLVLAEQGWDDEAEVMIERVYVAGGGGEPVVYGEAVRTLELVDLERELVEAGFSSVQFHAGWAGAVGAPGESWNVVIAR